MPLTRYHCPACGDRWHCTRPCPCPRCLGERGARVGGVATPAGRVGMLDLRLPPDAARELRRVLDAGEGCPPASPAGDVPEAAPLAEFLAARRGVHPSTAAQIREQAEEAARHVT